MENSIMSKSMTALTSKTSSQSFSLRVLKVIIQLREAALMAKQQQAKKDAEQKKEAEEKKEEEAKEGAKEPYPRRKRRR